MSNRALTISWTTCFTQNVTKLMIGVRGPIKGLTLLPRASMKVQSSQLASYQMVYWGNKWNNTRRKPMTDWTEIRKIGMIICWKHVTSTLLRCMRRSLIRTGKCKRLRMSFSIKCSDHTSFREILSSICLIGRNFTHSTRMTWNFRWIRETTGKLMIVKCIERIWYSIENY